MTEQLTSAPTRKVVVGGIAGAITIVMVWLIGQIWHVEIPPEVASAMTTIITFASSYMAKPAMSDQVTTTR